tara:strand:- start:13 stop:213 length:201 start_codon:yes stop_codon:yes gene_type:complete
MAKYKYIGEDKFFIKKGDVIDGDIVTWSVKDSGLNSRTEVGILYVKGAGFRGETMPLNSRNLIEVN